MAWRRGTAAGPTLPWHGLAVTAPSKGRYPFYSRLQSALMALALVYMSYLTISLSNGEGGGLIGSVDDDVTHFPGVEGLHWALAAF